MCCQLEFLIYFKHIQIPWPAPPASSSDSPKPFLSVMGVFVGSSPQISIDPSDLKFCRSAEPQFHIAAWQLWVLKREQLCQSDLGFHLLKPGLCGHYQVNLFSE